MSRKEMIKAFKESHMKQLGTKRARMEATRAEFLAYGFARGKPYRHIELTLREETPYPYDYLWYSFAKALRQLLPEEELKTIADPKRAFRDWVVFLPDDHEARTDAMERNREETLRRKAENKKRYEQQRQAV